MAARIFSRVNLVSKRFFAATASPGASLAEKELAEAKHAESTMKTWKLISYFVAVPGIIICTYNTYLKEKEHHEHPRAEFKPYSHLRIRSKLFPWGDGNHSLFHNPHVNPLPDGYEDEMEH
ncbi:cytochrome c oxidase subunit 6A, mitochondrial-like [Stylophora pistillata]|uniref:cytochrome c oxidase subunit 6A, mitochondrial-like n=1 Tax=Stylophora pistillata TaxID=50429 RepID=UPI000C04A192|nr:cytochrome c oxidase subunit 6A, mitochondrial-like [Stylophora pistillata]